MVWSADALAFKNEFEDNDEPKNNLNEGITLACVHLLENRV